MYKPVQVSCRLFYRLPHIIVAVEVENVRHEVEGILVILNFRVKACQVEPVGKIVFVDFAKILVSSGRDKL